MPATMNRMAPKKPAAKATGDRHKPSRMVRIPERVAVALESMGEEREASLAEMVKNGLIDFLTRADRWPPKPKPAP